VNPVRYISIDTWRWIDLFILVISIIFWIAGRFVFLPFIFILLSVIEILFELSIKRSNQEWQSTEEGKKWVRRMIRAGRLFFIPAKVLILLIALFLLFTG